MPASLYALHDARDRQLQATESDEDQEYCITGSASLSQEVQLRTAWIGEHRLGTKGVACCQQRAAQLFGSLECELIEGLGLAGRKSLLAEPARNLVGVDEGKIECLEIVPEKGRLSRTI